MKQLTVLVNFTSRKQQGHRTNITLNCTEKHHISHKVLQPNTNEEKSVSKTEQNSKTAYTREDQKEEEKEEGKPEEVKAFSRHASPSIGKYNNQVVVNTL